MHVPVKKIIIINDRHNDTINPCKVSTEWNKDYKYMVDVYFMYFLSMRPGDRLNIKMSSYQYRDPHVTDETVSRPSYF